MKSTVSRAFKSTLALFCALVMFAGCVTREPDNIRQNDFYAGNVWTDMAFYDVFLSGDLFLDMNLHTTFGIEAVRLTAPGAPFHIPMPSAPGSSRAENEFAVIDYSNASDGYVMIKYPGQAGQIVPVYVMVPNAGAPYMYLFATTGDFEIIPLSDGNGEYTVALGELLPDGKFAPFNMATFNAVLSDPFAPFLRPNRLVNYTLDTKVVKIAQDLIGGQTGLVERVKTIYNYVVDHFEYDYDLAANPPKGYVPDLDYVLDYGKAICYGYAGVMAAMLRSQGIITKLVFGYMADGTYHAWIDVYSDQDGWLSGIVFFDGSGWSLVDPTVASSGGESGEKYFMDNSNYTVHQVY